ncbi:MAG: hypothetical protein ACREFT_15880 [Acetobacteraceae bacterium]
MIVRDRYTAVFDADESGREQALIAETYDERIARLWRVGEGVADMTAEPALRVAIDPFLSQMREAVAFNAEEFPYLDAHAGPVVADALAEVSAGDLQATDAADRRVVALRALSAGALTAVLAQVLCPRSAPILIAIALRLQGGTSVRTWRVSDGLRPQRVLVDLTASRAIGREEHT